MSSVKVVVLLVPLIWLGAWGGDVYAATCTSRAAGGNWSNAGTWTGCGGGTPGNGDTAVIATTAGNVVTANVAVTVGAVIINANGRLNIGGNNWTVNGTTTVSGTIDQTSALGNATFVGLVTINNGGTWANTINEAITFRGGITNNGTFNGGTATQTFATNSQAIGGANPITFGGAITIGNNVTVTNNNTDIVTITGTLNGGNNNSTWTNGANSTLNYASATRPMVTGVFNASASGNTVNYNRAGAQTVDPTSYYHLTLSTSGAKTMTGVTTIGGDLTISGAATMTGNAGFTVAGAFNYASTGATTLTAATAISIGTFNQTAGTLIDNGNTITVAGTGAGTWTLSAGTFTPTGTVIFTGAAPQMGASNFYNLTINVGTTATLTGNATVSNVLALTNGTVTSGANVLDVASSCATAGIITRTNGYVFGNLSLHYPAGAASCTFPIGDATNYTPVTVAMANVTSSLANSILTASANPGDHPDTVALLSGIDPGKSVNRYWTLTQGALTFATYDATFTFVNGDIDSGSTTANFIVGRKSGGVWTYPTLGAKNPNDTTVNGITQANGFGEFAIGERAMPSITVVKSVTTYFDPVNTTTTPKAIPGAEMLYTVTVMNSGPGSVDDGRTVITDPIPANTIVCVSSACSDPPLSQPVVFTCSAAPACGLAFNYPASVTYSCSSLPCPQADPNGYGTNVTSITINPSGTFNGAFSPQSTNFSVTFKVKIN